MENQITIAKSVATGHAFNFGKAHRASAEAIQAQAAAFTELGIKPEWVPIDQFVEGNVVHVAVFNEVGRGYADGNARLAEILKMTKQERAKLSDDEKDVLENARRTIRRLVMAFLTQVVYVLRGNAAQGADGTGGKGDRATWSIEERIIGGLMAMHDALSGTDKVPQTQFMCDIQKQLKPVIDELSSKHGKAKAIKTGYGQKYKGSFAISKKK